MTATLRPYQLKACDKIAGFLASDPSRQLIVMATGTGKTHVIADAVRQASGRVLILVHRHELIGQAAGKLAAAAPHLKVGVEESAKRARRDSDVVIASIQSIGRQDSQRLSWLDPALVIIDEAHHAGANSYRNAIERIAPDAHVLGFTATPHRDKQPLFGEQGAPFDGVIYSYPIREAIEDGRLCNLRGYLVKTDIDVSRVRIIGGDFSEGELAEAIDTDTRTALAYKSWCEKAADRQTIIFCARVSHAEHVAEFFAAHGVRVACVSGETPKAKRADILERYHSGKIQVITNVGVLTEGYDAPETSCILMLRPTKSWTAYVQMIGRGARMPEGGEKVDCLVLDVVDVTGKHDVCTLPALAGLPIRLSLDGIGLDEAYGLADRLDIPEGESFEGTVHELPMHLEEQRMVQLLNRQQSASRTKDLTGEVFGWLEVLGKVGVSRHGHSMWKCKCRCGSETVLRGNRLTSGATKSCGCYRSESKKRDWLGVRCGMLVVVEGLGRDIKTRSTLLRVRCDCGGMSVISASNLREGNTTSCGCVRRGNALLNINKIRANNEKTKTG